MLKFRTMNVCDCSESDTHWTTETDATKDGLWDIIKEDQPG